MRVEMAGVEVSSRCKVPGLDGQVGARALCIHLRSRKVKVLRGAPSPLSMVGYREPRSMSIE